MSNFLLANLMVWSSCNNNGGGGFKKMSEFNQPQQTHENTEHIGFMNRAMQFARDTYYAAADRVEDVVDKVRPEVYDYRRPAALGVIFALGGLAGGLKGETSLASESATTPVPNAWDIINSERAKAIAENPGMIFLGPSEDQLNYNVSSAAGYSSFDEIKRVTFARTKNIRKYQVKLNLQNRRGVVPIANLQSPEDADGERLKQLRVSFDGDIFTDESLILTPMLRPSKGGKPRKWGKRVRLPSWDNLDPANLSKVETNKYDMADGIHKGIAYVRAKKLTKAQIKKGRFYIDVNQACQLRNEAYDPDHQGVCSTEQGKTYRIKPKRSTTYVPGRPSKPGDIFAHEK
jgi:hypothetical protein